MNCLLDNNPTHGSRTPASWFLALALAFASVTSASHAQLIWSDEFNSGSIPDSAVWSYDLGGGGWGNAELQTYTNSTDNVRIENGLLVITALSETLPGNRKNFTSGRIRTEDKLTFKYGTIEARIKIPDLANGLWPAFWTLGNNFSTVGWPDCGELDIAEWGHSSAIQAGVVNQRVGSAAHWEHNGGQADWGLTLDCTCNLNEDFHLYTVEWTPDLITTYLDGNQIWAMDISAANCTDCSEFHQHHFAILNLAVGGTFTGITGSRDITAPFPAELLVDYIRIYDNGFTELGGSSIGGGNDTTPPEAPSGLVASAGDGSVSLDWNDNAESDLDSYNVYRSTTSGSGHTVIAMGMTASNYVDSTVTNGTTYYYVVTAVDTSANESSFSNEASATPQSSGGGCTPSAAHVDSIALTTNNVGQGNKTGVATVTLVDDCGNPVSGATVSGTFSGTYSESSSGVTNSSGVATIETSASAKGAVSFTFCVDNVSSSLSYDSGANLETCDSI